MENKKMNTSAPEMTVSAQAAESAIIYKVAKNQVSALLAAIAQVQDLIVPIKKAGQVNFGLWSEDAEVDLETLKSVKSPKDAFFPQSETLYSCYREGKKLSIQPEELQKQPFVLFGVKGCDVKGIEVLDRVFLAEPVDTFYQARRENGTIVAMACHEPEETCFCKVFGVDCAEPKSDVAVWMTEENLYWKAMTEKGEKLTEQVLDVMTGVANQDQAEAGGCQCQNGDMAETGDAQKQNEVKNVTETLNWVAADESELDTEKSNIRAIVEQLPYTNLSLEGWDGNATEEKFNAPEWEELYKPCLACGTCTFVCPTCQCYDIKDYDTGHGVKRYRCWDSCMYSDFTMMAHGNNRTSQLQRFRQRFMHKLVYFPANNDGMYSCVGCGRCVSKCPSGLNIVKVIKKFQKPCSGENAGGEQV